MDIFLISNKMLDALDERLTQELKKGTDILFDNFGKGCSALMIRKDTTMKKKTKEYIIAYFDILEYKKIINNNLIQEDDFIKALSDAVNDVTSLKQNEIWGNKNPKIYCFSNNFVICIEYNKNSFADFIYKFSHLLVIMQVIQYKWFAFYNLLIRGSIVVGELYLKNSFIYGQGLINAYTLESTVSVYPRIIIQEELVERIKGQCIERFGDRLVQKDINEGNMINTYFNLELDELLKDEMIDKEFYNKWYNNYKSVKIVKDFDDIYFIDYLEYIKFVDLTCEESPTGEMWELLKLLYKNNIEFYLKNFSEDLCVLKKLLWCCNYINNFYVQNGEPKILRKSKLLLQTHINFENVTKAYLETSIKSNITKNEKKHLLKMIDIIESL